ncbi:hypothetical protein BHE74_00057992, partial [Ensete ventricosum]
GWSATYKGAAGCVQAPCKGWPPSVAVAPRARTTAARPQGPDAHGATARGSRPWPSRRWRLPAARLQGTAPRPGLLRARVAAGNSDRQPARCHPKATAPPPA